MNGSKVTRRKQKCYEQPQSDDVTRMLPSATGDDDGCVLDVDDAQVLSLTVSVTTMADLHSRLEPFLLLARSTRGAAAAKVIVDATAAVSDGCVC